MKLKKIRKILEDNQYVELLDPDPMNNLFGGKYEGLVGKLSEYYDNCEVVGIHLEPRIIHSEDNDETVLLTVMEIYITREGEAIK